MHFTGVVVLAVLIPPFALSQTSDSRGTSVSPSVNAVPSPSQEQLPVAQAPQPAGYANYSIMLVNPAGGAVVLMHNPENQLEFVEVSNTKQALSAGSVPVRAAELAEFINAIKEENARLVAENTRLRIEVATQVVPAAPTSPTPSRSELETQQHAQIEAEKAARRQQMIQTWLMLQNMNHGQTQNLNVTVSDCTRLPALCATAK